MSTELKLVLSSPKAHYKYGESVILPYTVTNISDRILYVIKERHAVAYEPPATLKITVGQCEQPEGLWYYSFTPPKLEELPPNETITSVLPIDMPIIRTEFDSDFRVLERELPLAGIINVYMEFGYGFEPFKSKSTDPTWSEFWNWQNRVRSEKIQLRVVV
jgi:hypothetical protein